METVLAALREGDLVNLEMYLEAVIVRTWEVYLEAVIVRT